MTLITPHPTTHAPSTALLPRLTLFFHVPWRTHASALALTLSSGFCAAPLAMAEDAPASKASMPAQHQALLKEYCVSCHGPDKQKGKVRVDDLPLTITNVQEADRWQKILDQMNSGDMPPEDEKQPESVAKANFLDDLAHVMVAARRTLGDQHGVITMRRLNRREYRNTLRELLGVEINVTELPSDTGTGGFDTMGSNLFMSGNQFEQYQGLGREALEEAFARQLAVSVEQKFHYEAETSTPIVEKFVAHQIDARERAKNWAKAVEEAAARPENQAIVAALRKESKNDSIFRRSWEKIPGAPSPRSFGFDKKGENDADLANDSMGAGWLPYHQYYMSLPALDRGAYLGTQTRHPAELTVNYITLLVPFSWPVGEYVVRVRIAATDDAEPDRRFMEFGLHPASGQILSTHEVTGTMAEPQVIEIPLTMTRGHAERNNRTFFIREKASWDTNDEGGRKRGDALKRNGFGPEVALWVDWIEIERKPDASKPKPPGITALGIPLDDKSPPPTPEAVRTAIERFATEAFRGQAPPAKYIDRLTRLYDVRRQAGDKPATAVKETLSVVLSSPAFLYLAEPAPEEKPRPLTDTELATRLSFFLWSAPPDATLRDLANRGELSKPDILAAQTERLLNDPRSEDLVHAFLHQWLGLDRLDFFMVNLAMYPRFDNSTKMAAKQEIYKTFAHILKENASVSDLLKSDYVVINSLLARYYGIPDVKGDAFRKVMLPKDSPRGGLLGMASVSLMGGNGDHTSPVERGAWVLRKLLNDPPPPAPANIPALTRLAGKVLTTRERMQAHQEDAQCASCHRKIDPIGFGLENFDAVGQWRTEDSTMATNASGKPDPKTKKTWTIDPAAVLHRGPAFNSYFELRDIIASRKEAFARGFSTALIEYALGRPCGFSDEDLVTGILKQTKEKNFATREFIHALVRSREFHTK